MQTERAEQAGGTRGRNPRSTLDLPPQGRDDAADPLAGSGGCQGRPIQTAAGTRAHNGSDYLENRTLGGTAHVVAYGCSSSTPKPSLQGCRDPAGGQSPEEGGQLVPNHPPNPKVHPEPLGHPPPDELLQVILKHVLGNRRLKTLCHLGRTSVDPKRHRPRACRPPARNFGSPGKPDAACSRDAAMHGILQNGGARRSPVAGATTEASRTRTSSGRQTSVVTSAVRIMAAAAVENKEWTAGPPTEAS